MSTFEIRSSAELSASEAGVVAAGAEQVSANVQTVAGATEQMSASIREIAHNAGSAASVASDAVTAVQAANTTVTHLGESSVEIGNVVKAMASIAAQTSVTNEMSRNVTEASAGSSEIAASISSVAEAASAANRGVGATLDSSSELTRMSVELSEMLKGFRFAAVNGAHVPPSTHDQITNAIAAHGAWKFRLAAAVAAGTHDQDVAAVAKDDRCAFGSWLRDTPAEPGQEELHTTGKALHAAFHREAANVLQKVDAKDLNGARGDTSIGGSFFEASRVLTETMIRWRRSISRGETLPVA